MTQATIDVLTAAIPHILAAPKDGAAISMVCRRPGYGKREFVDELTVTQARGIPGERWETAPWLRLPDGTGHPGIQVCILPQRVLDLIWTDRENMLHPGDTFIADIDLSEANMPAGQHLQVGSAILRVSEVFNDACVKWKTRYGADAKTWVSAPDHRPLRLRGVLCSVVRDGVLRNGDILSKTAAL